MSTSDCKHTWAPTRGRRIASSLTCAAAAVVAITGGATVHSVLSFGLFVAVFYAIGAAFLVGTLWCALRLCRVSVVLSATTIQVTNGTAALSIPFDEVADVTETHDGVRVRWGQGRIITIDRIVFADQDDCAHFVEVLSNRIPSHVAHLPEAGAP